MFRASSETAVASLLASLSENSAVEIEIPVNQPLPLQQRLPLRNCRIVRCQPYFTP
jgi:hypothetical protein